MPDTDMQYIPFELPCLNCGCTKNRHKLATKKKANFDHSAFSFTKRSLLAINLQFIPRCPTQMYPPLN